MPSTIFTARRYANAVYVVIVYLSVCPSVTSQSSTMTAKRRITQKSRMIAQGN